MIKGEFYWAVVGDANPEPVAVVTENGVRKAYTCGCPDPFVVDGPDASIVLIPKTARRWDAIYRSGTYNHSNTHPAMFEDVKPMTVPLKPAELRAAWEINEKRLVAEKARGVKHSHRRFNP